MLEIALEYNLDNFTALARSLLIADEVLLREESAEQGSFASDWNAEVDVSAIITLALESAWLLADLVLLSYSERRSWLIDRRNSIWSDYGNCVVILRRSCESLGYVAL